MDSHTRKERRKQKNREGAGVSTAHPCQDSQAVVSANQSKPRQPLLPTNQSSGSHLPANPSSGSLLPTNQSSDGQLCQPVGECGAGSGAGLKPTCPTLAEVVAGLCRSLLVLQFDIFLKACCSFILTILFFFFLEGEGSVYNIL